MVLEVKGTGSLVYIFDFPAAIFSQHIAEK